LVDEEYGSGWARASQNIRSVIADESVTERSIGIVVRHGRECCVGWYVICRYVAAKEQVIEYRVGVTGIVNGSIANGHNVVSADIM